MTKKDQILSIRRLLNDALEADLEQIAADGNTPLHEAIDLATEFKLAIYEKAKQLIEEK